MLAVDRHDPGTRPLGQLLSKGAGHHERLFVGQRHRLARFQRRPCAPQASRSRDRRHDAVDFWRLHEVVEGLGTNG